MNVTGGPVWESYAQGELVKTSVTREWEQAYIRRVRAHQVLTALANRPESIDQACAPSGRAEPLIYPV